jgi:hypothetical protein
MIEEIVDVAEDPPETGTNTKAKMSPFSTNETWA